MMLDDWLWLNLSPEVVFNTMNIIIKFEEFNKRELDIKKYIYIKVNHLIENGVE